MPVVGFQYMLPLVGYFLAALSVAACFSLPSRAVCWLWRMAGSVAVGMHGWFLYHWIDVGMMQNLTFLNQTSLVLWLLCVFLIIGGGWRVQHPSYALEPLGLLCFPLAGFSMILVAGFPARHMVDTWAHPETLLHIVLSLLMVSVLCFAGFQALLFVVQERFLRARLDGVMGRFPPLQTIEQHLLRMVRWGFFLLSVLCVSAIYSFMPGRVTVYVLHKIVLVGIIWCSFAGLLLGRYWLGVSGRTVAYSTLVGVGLLFVIYMGSIIMTGF